MFFYIKIHVFYIKIHVFLGACLQVWRSRLTEESTRAPNTKPRTPKRGGALAPPLYRLLSLACVWRARAFLCEPRAPDLQATSPQENRSAPFSGGLRRLSLI